MIPANRTWKLPRDLLEASYKKMGPDGARGSEGIVFWLGKLDADDTIATVTHIVAPAGKNVVKGPQLIHITADYFNDLTDAAIKNKLILVGQIHSHPGSYVDLSATDLKYGISIYQFLSVVAPFYAQRTPELQGCGIHTYEPNIGYRRLTRSEAKKRVTVSQKILTSEVEV